MFGRAKQEATKPEVPELLDPKQLDGHRQSFFFVAGNGRGGTTLLQAMLCSHKRLTIPPETHFFAAIGGIRARFGYRLEDLTTEQRRAFVKASLGHLGRFAQFGLNEHHVLANLAQTSGTYEDFFSVCIALYAASRGKPRCGEKTPRHIKHISRIAEAFPRAKFIVLLRDPRAVVRSELQAQFGSRSCFIIARRWRSYVDLHFRWREALPADRYFMLHFEDLIAEPEQQLAAICQFLGEDFDPQMLNYHCRPARETGFNSQEVWKRKTRSPIDVEVIDSWREQLSGNQLALIEHTVGDRLTALGYSSVAPSIGPVRLELYRAFDYSKSIPTTVVRGLRRFLARLRHGRPA